MYGERCYPVIECQSTEIKWLSIDWFDHQWFCVVAFDFSEFIVFEEVLKEEEKNFKRKKKTNEN